MTACTNNGGKARRVVTAALVGALSVGAVPAIALATGTGDGIQTLAADWYTDAKVTAAEDGKGAVFTGDLTKPVSFDVTSGKYLVPTEVTGQAGATEIDPNEYDLYYQAETPSTDWTGLNPTAGVYQYVNGKGQTITADYKTDKWLDADAAAAYFSGDLTDTADAPIKVAVDTYKVKVVEKGADPQTADGVTMSFRLVDEDPYASAYVYDAPNGVSDDTFVYDGADVEVGLVDGKGDPIKAGTFVVRGKDGVMIGSNYNLASDDTPTLTGVKAAGTYTIQYTSPDGDTYNYKFTVEKLDLAEAGLSVADQLERTLVADGFGSTIVSVPDRNTYIFGKMTMGNRSLTSAEQGLLKITDVKGPNGITYFDQTVNGEYTFTVENANPDTDSSVVNTATVTFSILDSEVYVDGTIDAYYGSQNTHTNSTVSINLTEGQAFDASKIKVRDKDGSPSWSGDQLEVTYVDVDSGKVVDAAALQSAGKYDVTVRVKPYQDENGLWVGGSRKFTVEVTGNKAYGDNVAFFIDGELAGASDSLEFDGTDLLQRVSATVANPEGGSFEMGTDFTLEARNSKDEVVESIVDVDDYYTITVKPLTIELDGNDAEFEFTLHVTPKSVTTLKDFAYDGEGREKNGSTEVFPTNKNELGPDASYPAGLYTNDAVAWTGSAVEVPGVQYKDAKGNWVSLDESLYNVVSIKDESGKVVKEAVDEGTYTVRIALSDEAKSNYSLVEREFDFEVVKYNPFDDVESPAWYASVVADAKFTNVVNGLSGTNMYAPAAEITRADAVCILFNLAGGDNALDDNMYTEESGWLTGFDDVDGNAYYAKAIAWAHNAGVANGSDGAFRPTDKITREELACLIANYAKASGSFVASDGSALEAMPDGAEVSGWAEESVAWAVENGIMGNGGSVDATANIIRAEVAAMAMNYADKF